MTPGPWSCPEYGRSFARTGQAHKCERWSVDVHQFRITEPSEFDDELVGWIGESFDVGEGRHLQNPICPNHG